VLTLRLRVVHCLPSAIRFGECVVPDAFRSCAELADPKAILNASDTTHIRIGMPRYSTVAGKIEAVTTPNASLPILAGIT
jgi:hypothetical protein